MVAVVGAATPPRKLLVPWLSVLGLVGMASLALMFQDSSRLWLIVVWALSAGATSFGVLVTVCSYAGRTPPEASFRLADAGFGIVFALALWSTPHLTGLSRDYREQLEGLPAEQRYAAELWCEIRRLGPEYDSGVQECVANLVETPYRNFRRYPAIVADGHARGELYRQVEAYLAMPAASEKDASVKADVQRKLDDFRHDEAEARAQRELVASLPPALYRDQSGCVRSLETDDRSLPCVRVSTAQDGGRR